ncbi:hypothetical protein IT575_08100 [bacterium]|nr:hypothetical protein [bacterium]
MDELLGGSTEKVVFPVQDGVAFLDQTLEQVEVEFRQNLIPQLREDLVVSIETLFTSKTQAYREALVGVLLVRIFLPDRNLARPYISLSGKSYNGRDIDERIVNPFLRKNAIPCSKGPYLNVFRRQFTFTPEAENQVRDKAAHQAMLALIDELRETTHEGAVAILSRLIYRFLMLREDSDVAVAAVNRLSVKQYILLLQSVINTPSGGLFPLMLASCMFETIVKVYGLNWTVDTQGINVADKASGTAGDITITSGVTVLFSIEVTVRPLDKNRLVQTFMDKIAPNEIVDYIFILKELPRDQEVLRQAQTYFGQGHEINFLEIAGWLEMQLINIGKLGRTTFNELLVNKLREKRVPKSLKLAWNESINRMLVGI